MASIYGVNLNEMVELGIGKKYNKLFDTLASSDNFFLSDGSTSGAAFTEADDQLIVGLDNSKGAFVRPVAQQHESGGSFTTLADDQWSSRSEKLGFYGFLEEGRVCIDSRAVVGINVR